MNLFYLARSRKRCARFHCNKHVVKMILETAQLLCTALWVNGQEAPYRKTHVNHPCAIWARANKSNFRWLLKFGKILCKEYTFRYGKIHKTQSVLESLTCPDALPEGIFTEPPQCMPDQYKVKDNAKLAYRNYYRIGKADIHKNSEDSWKFRKIPNWI